MGAFIVKQPNGKYARFSTIIDCITDYDMTEEDYINLCIEKAKIEAEREARQVLEKYVRPFDWVFDYFYPNNQSYPEFIEQLKEMGATEEQIKRVQENQRIYENETEGE